MAKGDQFHYYVPAEQLKGSAKSVELWRIYYGDGSTFDSKAGLWEVAPSENVQVVTLFETTRDRQGRPTRYIMNGSDYYFKDGEIFGHSFDDITKARGSIKFGKYLTDEAFELIRRFAVEDYSV